MRVDEGGGHSDEDRGRPWVRSLFFVLAIAAWILFSLRPPEGRAGSEQAGYVVGSLVGTLLLALLIRFLYVKVTSGRRVWSPWLFVIAAAIGLLGLIARVGDAAEDQDTRATASVVDRR